jgi:hypothetical protein
MYTGTQCLQHHTYPLTSSRQTWQWCWSMAARCKLSLPPWAAQVDRVREAVEDAFMAMEEQQQVFRPYLDMLLNNRALDIPGLGPAFVSRVIGSAAHPAPDNGTPADLGGPPFWWDHRSGPLRSNQHQATVFCVGCTLA